MDIIRYLLPLIFLFFMLLLPVQILAANGAAVRLPVWAGSFYPADPELLRESLKTYCHFETSQDEPAQRRLRALVLPHAGYIYSGPVAGNAARVLHRGMYDRVVLIGPDHNVGFKGGAISDAEYFRTPLGDIPLDPEAARLRKENSFFFSDALSDQREHSLEVVLPFLQYLLGEFRLIPIVLGPTDIEAVTRILQPLLDERTLLVISSDLSHFLPDEDARQQDHVTIEGLLKLNSDPLHRHNSACGRYGLELLLNLSRDDHWRPELLAYANSGDTAGDKGRVVGYSALAYFDESDNRESRDRLTPAEGQALVELARKTLADSLGLGKVSLGQDVVDLLKSPALVREGAAFVTLTRKGWLRGCIGSLSARRSLKEDVIVNAGNAAFHDPRFQPLTADEFGDLDIEVSVLTKPIPLEYEDGEDLIRRLRPDIDGVILEYDGHGATYLPQVWEQLPNPSQFLTRLSLKAGLPGDVWKKHKLEVKTYQVQHFNRKAGQD